MEKRNRLLAEELQGLLAARKKRKRRKGAGAAEKECSNCRTKATPEWRRGPSGNRDLCNSCGLRWAKQQGRISPRTSSHRSTKSAHSDVTNVSSSGRQGARGSGAGIAGAGAGAGASGAHSVASDAMSVDEPAVGAGAQERGAAASGRGNSGSNEQRQQGQVTKAAKMKQTGFASGSAPTKREATP